MTIPKVKDTETSEAEIANRDCHSTYQYYFLPSEKKNELELKNLTLYNIIKIRKKRGNYEIKRIYGAPRQKF